MKIIKKIFLYVICGIIVIFLTTIIKNISFAQTASDTLQSQDLLKINIFAVVSPNIENAVHAISQDLKEQEDLETFAYKGYQIHCTLYMTLYPPSALSELTQKVASFAQTVKKFPAKTNGMKITKNNWFFLDLYKDRNLQNLSDAVVNFASPLRAITNYIPEWVKDYPEKLEMIKQYGSPNVFSQFEPHLTLLSKSNGEVLARFYERNKQNPKYATPIEGEIIGIGIGIADKDGQIASPTAIFKFKD